MYQLRSRKHLHSLVERFRLVLLVEGTCFLSAQLTHLQIRHSESIVVDGLQNVVELFKRIRLYQTKSPVTNEVSVKQGSTTQE